MEDKISVKKPLVVILNNSNLNQAVRNSHRIYIDLSTELYFDNPKLVNGSFKRINTKFSIERIMAHEMGHGIMGITDKDNKNVEFTDSIMAEINQTIRGGLC
jgi:hypothetical protein